MTGRSPLPLELQHSPFLVRRSAALGIARSRLRASDLHSPFHGVRVARRVAGSYLHHCLACTTWMRPPQVFSHITAARLWQMPLPWRLERTVDQRPIDVTAPGRPVRRDGVAGHRMPHDPDATVLYGRLPVTGAVRTWLSLGALLSVQELTIVADDLISTPLRPDVASWHLPSRSGRLDGMVALPTDVKSLTAISRPVATREQLIAAAASFRGHGCGRLRAAAAGCRERVQSAGETRLRLDVVGAGLGESEVNPAIRDDAGALLGFADLYFRRERVAGEYQSQWHMSVERYAADIVRIERLEQHGIRVVQITAEDLRRSRAAERIGRALQERGRG